MRSVPGMVSVGRLVDATGSHWSLVETQFQQHEGAATVTYLHLSPEGPVLTKELALQLAGWMTGWAEGKDPDAPTTD